MVMFFEDLADDVLLAVLQETPLASRILRLTLVNRRLHHLVGESLRRTRSLAIVFPRKAKNSSRKLPPSSSSSSPDHRLAYFRQNYRLKVLPKSAHLNFCFHHHSTKRSFPANHLLNLFPQLTTLQLVHPPLGDSRHYFYQLIAFLGGLKDHLRHLSIFFLCTSSKASEQAVLGRLEQLIRAAAQNGSSKLLRSLTLTFDLTHQLMDPAVWEFDDEGVGRRRNGVPNIKGKSGPTSPSPPPLLDLSHLQELTVLFAGDYYFAEVNKSSFCQFKKILKFCLFLFI